MQALGFIILDVILYGAMALQIILGIWFILFLLSRAAKGGWDEPGE